MFQFKTLMLSIDPEEDDEDGDGAYHKPAPPPKLLRQDYNKSSNEYEGAVYKKQTMDTSQQLTPHVVVVPKPMYTPTELPSLTEPIPNNTPSVVTPSSVAPVPPPPTTNNVNHIDSNSHNSDRTNEDGVYNERTISLSKCVLPPSTSPSRNYSASTSNNGPISVIEENHYEVKTSVAENDDGNRDTPAPITLKVRI